MGFPYSMSYINEFSQSIIKTSFLSECGVLLTCRCKHNNFGKKKNVSFEKMIVKMALSTNILNKWELKHRKSQIYHAKQKKNVFAKNDSGLKLTVQYLTCVLYLRSYVTWTIKLETWALLSVLHITL